MHPSCLRAFISVVGREFIELSNEELKANERENEESFACAFRVLCKKLFCCFFLFYFDSCHAAYNSFVGAARVRSATFFSLCPSVQPTNKVWFSGVLFDRFGWLAKNTLTFLRIGSNLSFGDTHCTNRPFEKRISRFVYLNQRETVLSFSVADEKHLI